MQTKQHDYHEIENPDCKRCGSRYKEYQKDGICTIIRSASDQCPVRCVGEWEKQKLYFLLRYFTMFTQSMKSKWRLNYIEIGSGPGRVVVRDNGVEIDGTAMAILNHELAHHLESFLFIDISDSVISSLSSRKKSHPLDNKIHIARADYCDQKQLIKAFQEFNKKSLNLVFLDPTDCSFPFESIRTLREILPKSDFIINFAYGTDLIRNIISAFSHKQAQIKYTNFLGSDFFSLPENIVLAEEKTETSSRKLTQNFIEQYEKNLQGLGLSHTYKYDSQIEHYYVLIFASSNEIAKKFWKEAGRYQPNEQKILEFYDV